MILVSCVCKQGVHLVSLERQDKRVASLAGVDECLKLDCAVLGSAKSNFSWWYSIGGALCRVDDKPQLEAGTCVQVRLRLCGGKGGFGALLKGKGKIRHPVPDDECRDLQGRRLGTLRQVAAANGSAGPIFQNSPSAGQDERATEVNMQRNARTIVKREALAESERQRAQKRSHAETCVPSEDAQSESQKRRHRMEQAVAAGVKQRALQREAQKENAGLGDDTSPASALVDGLWQVSREDDDSESA
ncbi:Protein SDE2-like [Porphyridium purpureum]|uniref:Protein SDE2-like n=1 Tax=Porphyridium purpureum TaxID=35688 RepID=A0A5J4Z637_PORPP|nr:Protein SDE2-like [Porphyridium purpureum]|eukprot:POR6790..scf295_1